MWQLPAVLMNIRQCIREPIHVCFGTGLSYYILASNLKYPPFPYLGFLLNAVTITKYKKAQANISDLPIAIHSY